MYSELAEPPVKKRRSKWDVVATETETTTTGAAAVAAAKINAMLAAKGKLVKQDNVILPPTTKTPTLGTKAMPSFAVGRTALLTPPPNVAPLYSTPPSSSHGHVYIQEKVFVGLEEASGSFNVAERLKGADNSYLNHISAQTGSKAFLRGKGSGFIEPTSGRESFEALHIFISHLTQEGVNNARKLCQSLIDTVKRDYEHYKASQSGPLGFGGVPSSNGNTSRPNVNPYSLQPSSYQGYQGPAPSAHVNYYGPPQGPHGFNYPGPSYPPPPPPPPPPASHYGPPSAHPYPYPPPLINHSPPQDEMTGLPNAFIDYRTYDKVDVTSAGDQVKRRFTEETESSLKQQAESSHRTVQESSGKRRFTEVANSRSDKEQPEKKDEPAESTIQYRDITNEKPVVGKWQGLTQPSTLKPASSTPLGTSQEVDQKSANDFMPPPSLPGGFKNLMPPPSLPGGLKGQKKKVQWEMKLPSNSEEENSKLIGSRVVESKTPGLSLLAYYADDSDSDNDL